MEVVLFEFTNAVRENYILEGGRISLQEKVLVRDACVKICIHTNESCKHNIPHITAYYQNYEYVISIDDNIRIIHRSGREKYGNHLIKYYISPKLQILREEWNKINSNYKFIYDNGMYCVPSK